MEKIDYFSDTNASSDLKGKTIRGGAVTAIGQAFQIVIQFSCIPVLARLLSPADFGLFAMALFMTDFARLFVDAGLSMATVQRPKITHQQVSNLFWLALGIGCVAAAVVASTVPIVAWFYDEPRLVNITLVLSLAFILSSLSVQHFALMQRKMQFRALAFIQVAMAFFSQGLGVWWAWRYQSYWALVIISLSLPIVRLVLAWSFCRWRPGLPSRGTGVRQMVGFGANVFGYNFVNYATTNVDRMLIGWYWGATPLGIYERAFKMLRFPLRQINGPATSVAIAVLSRAIESPQKYRNGYLQIATSMLICMCPLLVYLGFSAHWCVQIMLGPQWHETAPIFQWLAAASLVQITTIAVSWLFITQDRTRELLQYGLISAGPIVLSFILGLPWGPLGVVRAFTLTNLLLVLPFLLWWAGRRGPVTTADLWKALRSVVPYAVAVALANACIHAYVTIQSPFTGLLITFPVSLISWFVIATMTDSGRSLLSHGVSLMRASSR